MTRCAVSDGSEIAVVKVEDLIGPLNEMERKHAPERLWIGGDASIFELGNPGFGGRFTVGIPRGDSSGSPTCPGTDPARYRRSEWFGSGDRYGRARNGDGLRRSYGCGARHAVGPRSATRKLQAATADHPRSSGGHPILAGSAGSEDELYDTQPDDGAPVSSDDNRGSGSEQRDQTSGVGSDPSWPTFVLSRISSHVDRYFLGSEAHGLWC